MSVMGFLCTDGSNVVVVRYSITLRDGEKQNTKVANIRVHKKKTTNISNFECNTLSFSSSMKAAGNSNTPGYVV